MTPAHILDAVIHACKTEPIDLLHNGDGPGEAAYINSNIPDYHRTIQDILPFSENGRGRILEIGAFLGVVSIALARLGFTVTATDIPEFFQNDRLRERYRREGIDAVPLNLRNYRLPFPAEAFDTVVMCETLEHLNFNPLPAILEINRVIKPGGILYLSVPNIASLQNRVFLLLGRSIHNPIRDFFSQLGDQENMIVGLHWREYTRREIREMLDEMGFSIGRQYLFSKRTRYLPLKLVYKIAPFLRPNITTIARKEFFPDRRFQFCEAVR